MDFVLDANVLFAALIKDSITVELLLNENIHLFAPEFLLKEFYNNIAEILEKTNRTKQEFNDIFEILKAIITVIPNEEFKGYLKEAEDILINHPKDVPYFALAFKLKCPIWSNENRLKKQNIIKVFSTRDVLKLIKT